MVAANGTADSLAGYGSAHGPAGDAGADSDDADVLTREIPPETFSPAPRETRMENAVQTFSRLSGVVLFLGAIVAIAIFLLR